MVAQTGSSYIPISVIDNHKSPNSKSGVYDHRELEDGIDKRQQQRRSAGNSEMAGKTGNIYVSRNMTDSVKIPKQILDFQPG